MANNKGKKYKKLRGDEKPTTDSAREALAFMGWFGLRFEQIRQMFGNAFDDEVAVDTALRIRQDIELKGLVIGGKYRNYFMRAYKMNLLRAKIKANAHNALHVDIDGARDYGNDTDGAPLWRDILPADDYDPRDYELAVNTLRDEVLDFVQRHHDPLAASLFEIYVELSPDLSYKSLGKLFGIPDRTVWQGIGAIKKDVVHWFAERRAYLLNP